MVLDKLDEVLDVINYFAILSKRVNKVFQKNQLILLCAKFSWSYLKNAVPTGWSNIAYFFAKFSP